MGGVTRDLLASYAESDAVGLAELVHRGEVAPSELAEAAIATIERLNPELNAVIHRLDDMARAIAADVDPAAAFAGVPFLLKELASSWAGAPLTNSSFYLKDLVASEDTEAVRRMKAAGLVLVGKSNAPENGWAIATEPKLYGPTLNPWDTSVTPGGSSGGTAAAVASRMIPIGEASDGAGSIRVPASCCGVVGLKPSRGRVTLAPMGDYWYGGAYFLCCSRTVRDTAAYLDALAGGALGDPYTPPAPEAPWRTLAARPPGRLRIGYTVAPLCGAPIDADVAAAVEATARNLADLDHDVTSHDMTLDAEAAWARYTRMTCVQTAAMFDDLAPVVGRAVTEADVEPVTWAIIERGRATDGVTHIRDVEAIRQVGRQISRDLAPFDIFVTPTLTQPPRPVGYYDMSEPDLDAYNAKWTDSMFTFPFNISGQPAISLPLGQTRGGLPVGVQLVAGYGDEAALLAVAAQLEEAMPWRERKPAIHA